MKRDKATLERQTAAGTDIHDLSSDLAALVADSEVSEGWLMLFVPGSTAALTTIEFESGAVNDLKRALEGVAPEGGEYEHNLRWGDGNGYAHVRAALMGPSLVVPITKGQLATGTWQQVILCDFDNRPRQRRITAQILGI
jgi:secondary thiamine-phosphate synthase enzyme